MKTALQILTAICIIQNSSFATETITTGNLLEQDFTKWNGNTPILNDSIHDNYTLPGIENGYAEYTINQSETGLSPDILNRGFESELAADIWFWSHSNQTVKMSQTYDDGEGNITDQHRTVTGNCGTECNTLHNYKKYTDTLIVGENTATQGAVTVRFDFNSVYNNPNYPTTHYGADVEHPTLRIKYTLPDLPPLPGLPELIPDDFPINEIFNPIEFIEPPMINMPPIDIPKEEIDRPQDIMVNTYREPEPPMEIPDEIEEQPIREEPVANQPAPKPDRPRQEEPPVETAVEERPEEPMETNLVERPEPEEQPMEMVEEQPEEIEEIEIVEAEIEEEQPEIKEKIDLDVDLNAIKTTVNIIKPTKQGLLGEEPNLEVYASVNNTLFTDEQLPTGDLMFFKQIKLEGYDKTIYNNKEKKLAMMMQDPIFVYNVRLQKSRNKTDTAYRKLKEALSARNNI